MSLSSLFSALWAALSSGCFDPPPLIGQNGASRLGCPAEGGRGRMRTGGGKMRRIITRSMVYKRHHEIETRPDLHPWVGRSRLPKASLASLARLSSSRSQPLLLNADKYKNCKDRGTDANGRNVIGTPITSNTKHGPQQPAPIFWQATQMMKGHKDKFFLRKRTSKNIFFSSEIQRLLQKILHKFTAIS